MSLTPLHIALEAAIEAGDYFRTRLTAEKVVKTKSSPSDLVTDVDPMCEKMIRERIMKAFPLHEVLGEETTEPGAMASRAAAENALVHPDLWIVDPLDGTTNFVVGIPLSTVSIAYAKNTEVQVGVVYDPYREEVFLAEKGKGAFVASRQEVLEWVKHHHEGTPESLATPAPGLALALALGLALAPAPGQRIYASKVTELRRSVMASGFPTRSPARELTTEAGIRLSGKLKSFRALGSAALHMAYVASGRIDGFWEYDLNAWDLAAGSLLVLESGGLVEELQGGPYSLLTRDVLAAGTQEVMMSTRETVAPRNAKEVK